MSHITGYGNKYTNQEWAEMQERFRSEAQRDDEIEAQIDKMINYLKRQCQEFGMDEGETDTIAQLFRSGDWLDVDVQFSSRAKEEFLNDLWDRWNKAMSKLN